MLSYLHEYHAGNHADLLKHYTLTYILNYLSKKDEPYSFFDTHAGSGLYDLLDNRSIKTGEAQKGIEKLLENKIEYSPALNDYIQIAERYNEKRMYPGSPEIERILLSNKSILNLAELHPEEFTNLKNNLHKNQFSKRLDEIKIQIHHRNGYEMLNALTPPVIKRGGVLIDPSYEESSEFDDILETIQNVHKKWCSGIIILWYPLLSLKEAQTEKMLSSIISAVKKQNENTNMIDLRLCVNNKDAHIETELSDKMIENPPRLYGSGMFVINPPWKLDESAKTDLETIVSIIAPQNGSSSVKNY